MEGGGDVRVPVEIPSVSGNYLSLTAHIWPCISTNTPMDILSVKQYWLCPYECMAAIGRGAVAGLRSVPQSRRDGEREYVQHGQK